MSSGRDGHDEEPHLSEFKRLIRAGAASQDVHDSGGTEGFASTTGLVEDAYLQREVGRVEMHLQALTPLLERHVGAAHRVLDFGCGTGGTTVALALSRLGARATVGVDANATALAAARVRAAGHDLDEAQLRFRHVPAGHPLPFPDASFDLVTTVSVLEFISHAGTPARFRA